MGELYERILGQHPTLPKVMVDPLQSTLAEWQRGRVTAQQAQQITEFYSGAPLGAAAITEIQDLLATIPSGTTTALRLDRIERLQVIAQVLMLADAAAPNYSTPALLRTRLGVPTR